MTVTGVNLGKAAADLQVTVADSVCNVVDSYVPSERCVVFVIGFFHYHSIFTETLTTVLVIIMDVEILFLKFKL